MNFLLRNSQHNSEAQSSSAAAAAAEAERDRWVTEAIQNSSSQGSLPVFTPGGDSVGLEDFRGGDTGRTRTRVPILDHEDVSSNEGGIFIPSCELSENWTSATDTSSLACLDRGFALPGEHLNIVVYLSSQDLSVPEVITPFKLAAVMNKTTCAQSSMSHFENGIQEKTIGVAEDTNGAPHKLETQANSQYFPSPSENGVKASDTVLNDGGKGLDATESLIQEGQKKRSAQLLESFQTSHYFVRIAGPDEPLWKRRNFGGRRSSASSSNEGDDDATYLMSSAAVLMEKQGYDPSVASGLCRCAVTCCSLENGDIVVVLEVTVAMDLPENEAILEVLQFEQFRPERKRSTAGTAAVKASDAVGSSEQLLQWLLPLDRPYVSPSPPAPPSMSSVVGSSPQKPSFSTSSNSTLFSFSHLRSPSQSSLSQNMSLSNSPATFLSPSPLTYGPEVWDRMFPEKDFRMQETGSEGLLSFRGASLEPQRFSVCCGLEGLFVPGKRWRRKISVLRPIALESYFANCNTEDLICVLIENVIPPDIPGVTIFVDSINIICQSASSGSPSQQVPIACVEVGESHKLPGLALSSGEQHSFVLRPLTPSWKLPIHEDGKNTPARFHQGYDGAHPTSASQSTPTIAGLQKFPEGNTSEIESSHYAVIVSCRCSHTESRLYFKHPLQWRPRPPRDLLLSVSLEDSTPTLVPNEALPQLKSQVVAVQATNLSSEDLDLTLLAPSSLLSSPFSVLSFPATNAPHLSSFRSFHERHNREPVKKSGKEGEKHLSAQAQNLRSLSYPPAKQMETAVGKSPLFFRERHISAADIVAENSPARSHLWLQSTVPLGRIPAHSTAVVRCDLLPLNDGIITLDTLHITNREHTTLYVPEYALQIHSTSSLASSIP
ncbi:hypothetical protein O6H91_Y074600 [Diphasiastrum complanatum]|nr:hypothetical protein O6H91_Y074600 [Diphasiastrum complanatum]KAJ7300100.1 hypothetical protein O6H91_Y074600 [Diphasiastrum complanatum]KAJ7300101.1 hypothetical protein O6H91_Y074600 [Diphasiastrum complanatum]